MALCTRNPRRTPDCGRRGPRDQASGVAQSTVAGRELIIDTVRGLGDFAERARHEPAWSLDHPVAGIRVLGPFAIRFEAAAELAGELAGTWPFAIERWDLSSGQVVLTHKQPRRWCQGKFRGS